MKEKHRHVSKTFTTIHHHTPPSTTTHHHPHHLTDQSFVQVHILFVAAGFRMFRPKQITPHHKWKARLTGLYPGGDEGGHQLVAGVQILPNDIFRGCIVRPRLVLPSVKPQNRSKHAMGGPSQQITPHFSTVIACPRF